MMRIKSNNKIAGNIASLSLLQIANYLIPIIVIPFIARSLGVEMIGKVSFAQNIIQYFTIVITFGFDYSATRQIAIHKENHEKVKEIFWSVIVTKIMLLILMFLVFLIISLFYGKIQEDMPLYLCLFMVNIGFTFFPVWFFQGIEEMKSMAIINFLIKLFGTGLSVFFISSPDDYLIFAIMPSISYAVFGLYAFIHVIRKYDLQHSKVSKNSIIEQTELSFPIFLNSFFTTFYTIANLTILGNFDNITNAELGYYSGAHKIIMCVLMVTSMPIHIAIFPSISRKFAESKKDGIHYLKQMAKYIIVASIVISLLSYLFSPLMVKILLGKEFLPAIPLLKLFSCLPFLVITASLCTVQGLYGLGFQKYAPYVGLIVGVICIMLNLYLIPLYGMYGAAISWIISQAIEILISGSIVYIKSKQL